MRKKTRPTKGSQERRIESKKRRGSTKQAAAAGGVAPRLGLGPVLGFRVAPKARSRHCPRVTCRMLCLICSDSTSWASAATPSNGSPNSSLFVIGHLNDVAPPQQLDEIAEQALVEEFRRVQPVKHRHALRHQVAALLERFAVMTPLPACSNSAIAR